MEHMGIGKPQSFGATGNLDETSSADFVVLYLTSCVFLQLCQNECVCVCVCGWVHVSLYDPNRGLLHISYLAYAPLYLHVSIQIYIPI